MPITNGKHDLHLKINIYASEAGESKQQVHFSPSCSNSMATRKRANHEFKTHTQTPSEPIGREGRGREERHCRDASMMRCCSSWLLSTLELHQRGCRASRSVNLVIAGPTGAPEACHPRAQWYVELRGRSREPSGKHADAVARLKHSSCIGADSFQGLQPW